jgi:DDE superfamily endonuclease
LVADTAFPHGTDDIKGRIRKPIKAGQQIRGNLEEVEQRLLFDRELLSYRQTAEWGMRSIQGSFGRLRIPLEINHTERRGNLLEICVRLHNLRTRKVGINQIRNVYMKQWMYNAEQEDVWKNFENMLFSDQRAKDRVSNYHTYASWE